MPSPRATRGSSTAARSRLPKRVRVRTELQRRRVSSAADDDDEAAVDADADAERSRRGPAARPAAGCSAGCEPIEVVDRRHRHEHQADREQHLVEVRLRPYMRPVERALEHAAPSSAGADEGQRQAGEERHAAAVHQEHRDVAAGHGEGAVREVDEVHQAQRHRQPARRARTAACRRRCRRRGWSAWSSILRDARLHAARGLAATSALAGSPGAAIATSRPSPDP